MIKTIIYQGVQYNISPFLKDHPGGASVIEHYISIKKDITECFKSMHSKKAEQKLLSLESIDKAERSKFERIYCKIEERVKRFYAPSYFNEITFALFLIAVAIFCLWTSNSLSIIAATALLQIMTAWSSHSQMHQRRSLATLAKIMGGMLLGLSASWWREKHEKHHLFTNQASLDQDIKYKYPVYLYPLMLLKWRLESIYWAIKRLKLLELIIIGLHYFAIFKFKVALPFLIGVGFASFYLAIITQGNHEREMRYKTGHLNDFLPDQLQSTRNYDWKGWVWSWILGGFNYHTEHHLFPQKAHRILFQQLQIYKKSIETGPILI